jgi:hypothetical protein
MKQVPEGKVDSRNDRKLRAGNHASADPQPMDKDHGHANNKNGTDRSQNDGRSANDNNPEYPA